MCTQKAPKVRGQMCSQMSCREVDRLTLRVHGSSCLEPEPRAAPLHWASVSESRSA